MKKTLLNIFNICFLAVGIIIFGAAFSQAAVQSMISVGLTIPCLALILYFCVKKANPLKKSIMKTHG